MLVLEAGLGRVLAASAGLAQLLGLGKEPHPGDAVPDDLPHGLLDALRALPSGATSPVALGGAPAALECLAHRTADGVLVEWLRPTESRIDGLAALAAEAVAALAAAPANLHAGADLLAQRVAAVSGYDRVLVYRFHADWSGEVVAELRRPDLPPYLGLRYPASDIPPQARALYLRNLLRVVVDAQDIPIPLRHGGAQPPDLGMAMLRSVSPIHVQYLRNMGVRATLTASLIHEGRLWGMIACHHGSPRLPGRAHREAVLALSTAFSALLARVAAAERDQQARLVRDLRRVGGCPPDAEALARLLLRHDGLAAAADAEGIAWVGGGRIIALGLTPDLPTLERLAREAGPPGEQRATTQLDGIAPDDPQRMAPAGMLEVALSGGWIALFRRELLQEIHWAGNPEKVLEPGPSGELSPRRSFALWRQQVRGACRPWGEEERALLGAAAEILSAAGPAERLAAHAARAAVEVAGNDHAALHSLTELLMPHAMALLLEGSGEERRLVEMTPALARLLGVSPSALCGRPWAEVLPQLGLSPIADIGMEPEAREQDHIAFSPIYGTLTLRLTLETALQVAGPEAQPPLRFDLLVVEDETRGGRLRLALRAAALQAERARRSREAFLRNASHELRTPLNAIIGFAELLGSPTLSLSKEAARRYAGEIAQAGQGMLALVENLLLVARIESGRLEPRPQPIDLVELLQRQATLLEPLFAAKGVRLRLELPPGAPCVSDPGLIGPPVQNLLSNALKFTPSNGDVVCALSLAPGVAEIRVTDTGPGIPAEDRERIFQAFEQGDDSIARSHGGAGLGLFIARNMAESLGGSLSLDGSVPGGSSFVLRLPTG